MTKHITKEEYKASLDNLNSVKHSNVGARLLSGIRIRNDYIASLESQNATLTADNLSLVEQVNVAGNNVNALRSELAKTQKALDDVLAKLDSGEFMVARAMLRKWSMEKTLTPEQFRDEFKGEKK